MKSTAAIIGEAIAGDSAKVREKLENLLANIDKSTFDVAELLYDIKSGGYYSAWGYATFKEYIDTLKFKTAKAYYLTRIVDIMKKVGVSREKYEPLGINKLREITSLDPSDTFDGKPMGSFIIALIENGQENSLDKIKELVAGLKGLTGEDALVWVNFRVKQSVRDSAVRPALDLAKNALGSKGRDDDGNAIDASDGAALEAIAVEFLNDPANSVLPEEELNETNM